ncbi:DUF5988 family protein [Streptomyces sp. NPDC006645]|uniref:DUF5988 family protein n=1 Tax=unclassified Streptomyces TaxID=2593676 RepID=UPI0033BEB814
MNHDHDRGHDRERHDRGHGYRLVGGPAELVRDPVPPVRRDRTRMTIRWHNGYEHYELDEASVRTSSRPVYRWIYHTKIAE